MENVTGHVAVRHNTEGTITEEVNSYHNQACVQLKQGMQLQILAQTSVKFSKSGLSYIEEIMNKAYIDFADGQPWQQSGKPVKKAYMTDLLNAIIESGKTVKAERFSHGWIEFDTNEDYENAVEWSKDGSIKEVIRVK